MSIETPEGYRLPLRTSLTRPILLAGVPRAFAILNAKAAAAIARLRSTTCQDHGTGARRS